MAEPAANRLARFEPRVGGFSQWALIARAEAVRAARALCHRRPTPRPASPPALQEGLITVSVSLAAKDAETMRASLATFFLSPLGLANVASGTPLPPSDAQRNAVVAAVVDRFLLPAFAADVRALLGRVAGACVQETVEEAGGRVWWSADVPSGDGGPVAAAARDVAHHSLPSPPIPRPLSGDAIAAECADGLRRHVGFAPPIPPPRPARRRAQSFEQQRRGEGGADVGGVVAAALPWQRCRPRVIALAVARPGGGDARGGAAAAGGLAGGLAGADVAVALDPTGEPVAVLSLPPWGFGAGDAGDAGRAAAEAALAEMMLSHAPDVVVVSAGIAGQRARDARELAGKAALRCADLVAAARAHHKRRKALKRRYGPSASHHEDPRVAAEWDAASLGSAKLDAAGAVWATGAWDSGQHEYGITVARPSPSPQASGSPGSRARPARTRALSATETTRRCSAPS